MFQTKLKLIPALLSLGLLGSGTVLLGLAGAQPAPDKKTTTPPSTSETRQESLVLPHQLLINGAVFSPDGKLVATLAGPVFLWDAATGKKVMQLPSESGTPRFPGYFMRVAFSPDGKLLAASSGTNIVLFQTATGKDVRVLAAKSVVQGDLFFAGNGKTLSALSSAPPFKGIGPGGVPVMRPKEYEILNWDLATGRPLPSTTKSNNNLYAFSPDGKYLAETGFGSLRLQDVVIRERANAKIVHRIKREATVPTKIGNTVRSTTFLIFSPDGTQVALGEEMTGEATVHEVATGKAVAVFKHPGATITAAAFSPDGKTLATAAGRASIERNFPGVGGNPFTPPDQSSGDKNVLLWDLASGKEVARLSGHEKAVTLVAFSPDGQRVVSAAQDKSARLWHLPALLSGKPPTSATELEPVWADLTGADAGKSYRAGWTLAGAPQLTVPFLKQQLATPNEQKALRCVPVLARINTAEARALLKELSEGKVASVAAEAKTALERLNPSGSLAP